jgi:hypothetical protein
LFLGEEKWYAEFITVEKRNETMLQPFINKGFFGVSPFFLVF